MKKTYRLLTIFFSLLLTSVLIGSCEREETEISGPASLKIINDCTFTVSIYFDNDFIGKVDREDSRIWSVPTGSHEVKATSSFAGATEKNPTFYEGQMVIITLSQDKKSADAESITSREEQVPEGVY